MNSDKWRGVPWGHQRVSCARVFVLAIALFTPSIGPGHDSTGADTLSIPVSVGSSTSVDHVMGPGWSHVGVSGVAGKISSVSVLMRDADGNEVWSEKLGVNSSALTPRLTWGEYTFEVSAKGKRDSSASLDILHLPEPAGDAPTVWFITFLDDEYTIETTDPAGVTGIDWFEAEAIDAFGSSLNDEIVWYLDGVIGGAGPNPLIDLPLGTTTVAPTVFDGDSMGFDSRDIHVVGPLLVTVSTDKPTYRMGESALISVRVLDGFEDPVELPGTQFGFASITIDTPKGRSHSFGQLATDANGEVTVSFKPKGRGEYAVRAQAFHDSQRGSATTIFFVGN